MLEGIRLKELQHGSEAALEWFIRRYTAYVGAVIYQILGGCTDTADMEEVASDVFFTLWQHASEVRPGHVKGYLAAVARNKAKNKRREMDGCMPLNDSVTVDSEHPEKQLQQKELFEAVRRSVQNMPDPDREIFLRFYFYYQTAEQISRALQINLSTIKTKLRRGRAKLKQDLENYIT